MASNNPNGLKNVLPGAGGSFSVQTAEIFQNAVDSTCLAAGAVTATAIANATITGAKLVNNTITNTQIANNTVGSGQLALSLLQFVSVTLTPAQIKTLYSAPTQIIAAPGAGLSIVIVQALARFAYTTPAYTAGGAVQLQYDNTVHAGGTTPLTALAAATVTGTASVDTVLQTAATSTVVTQNKGIFASCATADFATGSVSTLTFDVWYQVV